jgi:hypothetical protein
MEREMKTPQRNEDLRHWDTRHALTDAERQEIRRGRQREALGLGEPRVAISQHYVPPNVARQFSIAWIRGAA